MVIAVINTNTTVTAVRIALGFLCTLCIASAAEKGNIPTQSPIVSTVAVAKQDVAKPVARPSWAKRSSVKTVDLALTRHTSSFHGPPGPTLAVGARYVRTPTAGLKKSWLDNLGEISEGEYVYDWPPGARLVSAAAVAPAPAASAPLAPGQTARR